MEKEKSRCIVKNSDMEPDMLEFATSQALLAQEKCSTEQEIATHLKHVFEDNFQPNWHCLVGRHFASFVTHEAKHFAYFYIGQMGFLIFKSV
mmetsp:Transcript_56743/g.64763  ORF Transcript_56743/g.64763 Transcript_56743/m.64763 type:complete len:92 (+) Transcript_56743:91-366(+)